LVNTGHGYYFVVTTLLLAHGLQISVMAVKAVWVSSVHKTFNKLFIELVT